MRINIEALRRDLVDYFGTAMMGNPIALMELVKVEQASPEELVKIAEDNNFDLEDYKIYEK